MKIIMIDIENKPVRRVKKIDREILWYDPYEKKMKKFRGGRLRLRYNRDDKKHYPEIEDVEEIYYENESNRQDISDWIYNVAGSLGIGINLSESSNKAIAIDIEKDNIDDVEDALDRKGFRYSEA